MKSAIGMLVAVVLLGCDTREHNAPEASLDALAVQTDLVTLKRELALLQDRVARQDSQIASPTDYDAASFAFVGNPTDPGYALGRSGFGKFAVIVEDIQPYGSGSRMTVKVLNLASATLNSATFTVNYDQQADSDNAPSPVTHRSTNFFPPDQWVSEVLNLPDLEPAKIKIVAVRFQPTAVSARR